jgi:hypothetical protein
MSMFWFVPIWQIINLALLAVIAYGLYRIYKAITK